jgi:dienelactone hydrolase
MGRERRRFLLQLGAALALVPLASRRSSGGDYLRYGAMRCYVAGPRELALKGVAQRSAQAGFLALAPDLADAGVGEARPESGKLGVIGFSAGGIAALRLAARSGKMEINTAVPAYEAALNAAGVQNAIQVYPGTAQGFAEERAPAWSRTLAFLKDALQ